MKTNFYNQGQSLIGIIIVLVIVGLISGGLYYYLSKQIPEVFEITEKPVEEEIVKPKEEEVTPPPEEKLPKEEVAPSEEKVEEKLVEKKPLVQKCADGTLYGQCSANKPKYCEAGQLIDKASKCGCPSGSKISGNHCVVERPSLNPKSGLIVIRRGVDGESYAREIASNKGWDILPVNTSDYNQIRNEIVNFYNRKPFDYLLLIGTIEEIPYAIYDVYNERWKTAPTLYGNVNNDRFIELAVGVLPFSSEAALKKYFTNLNPKGNFVTIENYTHHATGNAWWEYTFGRCLASASPSIRSHKLTSPLALANHYRESAVIFLRNAGAADAVFSKGMSPNPNHYIPVLHICSFDKNFDGELMIPGGRFFCDGKEIEYLTNRPIIFHNTCNTARELGKQLMENGAAAFFGPYYEGGFNIFLAKSKFLSGKSVGETKKHIYNSNVMVFTLTREHGAFGAVVNIPGLNTFNLNIGEEAPYSTRFDFMLYGDPTLKMPKHLQKLNTNTIIEQRNDRIVINVNPPKLFSSDADIKSDEFKNIMCYIGEAVSGPSFAGKENVFWFNNHVLVLTFPVTDVNRLKSKKVIIDNQEINLDNLRGEEYTINLLKGVSEQYLYLFIKNTSGSKGRLNRLDYTKNIQIQIEYE